MKVAGIIAEFNPFHNGHKYIIDYCKKELCADYVIIVMSGDFVQRGAPALLSKFTRARMALNCGADLVLELPVYYSLGSAEYFAEGAISIMEGLGVVTDVVFGSESNDIDLLESITDILVKEPESYKKSLQKALEEGESFPAARMKGVLAQATNSSCLLNSNCESVSEVCKIILSSPNSILGIEYLKALRRCGSSINAHAVKRIGAEYNSTKFNSSDVFPTASALGIRSFLKSNGLISSHSNTLSDSLSHAMPKQALMEFSNYNGTFLDGDSFTELLHYKLLLERNTGFTKYLDVNEDLSNRIVTNIPEFKTFDQFCQQLKSKNLTYTRISRCLMHIILNITEENMLTYKSAGFSAYGRVLGMRKDASALLSVIHSKTTIPVPPRLKDFEKELTDIQLKLFKETLTCSEIYNSISENGIISEYSLPPVVL